MCIPKYMCVCMYIYTHTPNLKLFYKNGIIPNHVQKPPIPLFCNSMIFVFWFAKEGPRSSGQPYVAGLGFGHEQRPKGLGLCRQYNLAEACPFNLVPLKHWNPNSYRLLLPQSLSTSRVRYSVFRCMPSQIKASRSSSVGHVLGLWLKSKLARPG